MSNPVDTYENHLEDVLEMHERMRKAWWNRLRQEKRIRKCTCGAWLIGLIRDKKKKRKTAKKYHWCELGMRDVRPWTRYFVPHKHRTHRCGDTRQMGLGGS